jgi:hypothetical protein
MTLDRKALYIEANGAILHGRCCGLSAQSTGKDRHGQPIVKVSPRVARALAMGMGGQLVCESCDKPGGA